MADKPSDPKKLVDKMRANTDEQSRRTWAKPRTRIRKKVEKTRKKP